MLQPRQKLAKISANECRAWLAKKKSAIIDLIKKSIENKTYKSIAGFALLAMIITSFYSYTTRKKSIEAYVTADMVTIQSPMDGVVTKSSLDGGSLFNAGEHLVSVSAARLDAQFLDQANNELAAIAVSLNNSNQKIRSSILNLKRQLEISINANTIELKEANNQTSLAEKRSIMHDLLEKQGAISSEKSMIAKAAYASQIATKEKALLKREILEKDLESLKKVLEILETQYAYPTRLTAHINITQNLNANLASGANRNDRAYSEEHTIKNIEELLSEYKFSETANSLAGNLHDLIGEHISLYNKLDSAKIRSEISKKRSSFDYYPKFNGMLLMKAVNNGDEVSESQPLLTLVNCDRKRVEALFSTAKIKDAIVGDEVKVKSTTSNQYTRGIIRSITGEQPMAGTRSAGNVVFQKADIDRARVTVDLVTGKKQLISHQSCNIGQKVIVEL